MVSPSSESPGTLRKIGKVQSIPLDRLIPNPANRKPGRDEDLRSLAASIAAVGLLYPLIVEPIPEQPDTYRIAAGERRWRALKLLKIEAAPCLVVPEGEDRPDPEILRVVENHQRKNLEPLEEAAAIRTLLDAGLPVEVVARSLGRSRAWIARRSSLTDLSERWVEQTRDKENKMALWPPSHLELISRFPREVQDQILDRMGSTWQRNFPTQEDLKSVAGDYLRLLSSAPWKLEDDTLRPLAGACTNCDKRSSHTPDLFSGELSPSGGRAVSGDHCLDPACWREKSILFLKRKIESLSQVRSDLMLLNTAEYIPLPALEEVFGRRVENAWNVTIGRKTDERAVPALIVNGAGLGRIKWVIPFENTSDTRHTETTPAAPEEPHERTLEEKKEPYDRRRRQLVIDAVRERLLTLVERQDPEDEALKALTTRGLLARTLYFLSALLTERGWKTSVQESGFNPPPDLAWSDFEDFRNHEIGSGGIRETFLTVCRSLLFFALDRYSIRLLVGSGERNNRGQYTDAETLCALLGLDLAQLRAQAATAIPYAKCWRDEVQDEWNSPSGTPDPALVGPSKEQDSEVVCTPV